MSRSEAPAMAAAPADPGIASSAGSNFHYSFLFLPPEKRHAIEAVYAFCRRVDDLVDEPTAGCDPRAALDRWQREIEALYGDGASLREPIALALAPHLERFPMPKRSFLDILDGCRMDLDRKRYDTWEDLREYCLRVASAVGLLCIEIFGYRQAASRDYAVSLGLALQMTNILRDLGGDARRGRIYLPGEDLRRFGVSEEDLLAGRYSEGFRGLMAHECAHTRKLYFQAEAVLPKEDRMALFAAEIMGRIYYRILEKIEACGFAVLDRRIAVPRHRKALIAFSVWLKYKILGGA